MQTVKVRLKMDLDGRRVGDEAEYAAPFARDLVAAGSADYVTDAPKWAKGRRDKMIRKVETVKG